MTGFARVRKAAPEGEIAVSIKSVNHRGLDMHFHMPPELDPFEGAIRNAVKAKVARGHVQIHVLFNRTAPADASSLNRPLLQAYLQAFREAAGEFGAESKPDLNAALRMPGMLQAGESAEPDAGLEQALLEATAEALDRVEPVSRARGRGHGGRDARALRIRLRSGGANGEDPVARHAGFPKETERAAARTVARRRHRAAAPGAGSGHAGRAQRYQRGTDPPEDPRRAGGKLLDADGEVGKRLDFLLQEMNREANTILSKTGGLGELGLTITDLALAAKAEIDKIREQSLNLE